MKKMTAFLSIILLGCLLLCGCGQSDASDPIAVCSFRGSNEFLAVSNGVIGFSRTDDVFYGGVLEGKQGDFSDVVFYSATFFVWNGDERHTLLSMSAADTTGTPLPIDGELGSVFTDELIPGADGNEIQLLKDGLFFELTVTNRAGESEVYLLQMTVTEITDSSQPERRS